MVNFGTPQEIVDAELKQYLDDIPNHGCGCVIATLLFFAVASLILIIFAK